MPCELSITPLDQSQLAQLPTLAVLNYTNQDYFSLKRRVQDLIKEKFSNDFNNFIESDLGIFLIEILAFIGDTTNFKIDQLGGEIFIDSVSEVENAFRLAKLVGFQPTPPLAARAFFSATINNVLNTDLTIPGGLAIEIVSNNTPITFELFPSDSENNPIFDEDIIIPTGNLTNTTIIGVEGQTVRDTFTGTGQVGQNNLLSLSPVIFDSVRVEVDGVRWQKIDYFSTNKPQREFRIEYDSNYNAYVIFGGNSNTGMIPSNSSQIQITYRIGGGTQGNIISGFIDQQINVEVPGFDFSVPVSFKNYTKGEFGYAGDGIEDVKRKLPYYLTTQDRIVSGNDYKIITDQFVTAYHGQIGKSIAVLRNYGCSANIIDLYILQKEGVFNLTKANDDLKLDLLEEINKKKMLSEYVCIKDGEILLVDITVDVIVDKLYRKNREELNTKVKNRINDFFLLYRWEFGQTLRDVDFIKFLSSIPELQKIDVSFSTSDPDNSGQIVSTKFNEIIRPNNINISFIFN